MPAPVSRPEGPAGRGRRWTGPVTSTDEIPKVSVMASRPRGNPPNEWYGQARLNEAFLQVDPHPELILETYVICTA